MNRRGFIALGLGGVLAACGKTYHTSYHAVPHDRARDWKVANVQVSVPNSLRVSESNSYIPTADIVWHGDRPGDRRAQVAAIFREAASRGSRDLTGTHPITLAITVQKFHALSPKARAMNANVGVYNITFTGQIFDAKTGKALSTPQTLEASAPALTGDKAKAAEAQGYGQKQEILRHLTSVFHNWLTGNGPDPRASFTRMGG